MALDILLIKQRRLAVEEGKRVKHRPRDKSQGEDKFQFQSFSPGSYSLSGSLSYPSYYYHIHKTINSHFFVV